MIHYLKIKNFGPIKDEMEINFEVADSNGIDDYIVEMPDKRQLIKLIYIFGANASGKTTILRAFEFLRLLLLHPNTQKEDTLNFEPFLFRNEPFSVNSFIELAFYVDGSRYIYSLEFNKMAIVSEKMVFFQTQKSTELFSRSTDLAKRFSKIDFGSKIKVPVREKDLLESNTLHNNTVLGAYAKTNVDIPELEVLNKWFSLFLLGLITPNSVLDSFTSALIENNPEANVWINRLLNKADGQLVEVNVGSSEDALSKIMLNENKVRYSTNYFKLDLKKKIYNNFPSQKPDRNALNEIIFKHKISDEETFSLPFDSESSGTKKYFGLAGPLYQIVHYPQFLCIDELENSLHPDLMKYFLQVFLVNSKGSQLLITTHTTSLMENEDFIRKDALWFCEKQSNGSINLYSAADFDSGTLRKDSNIQKAYKAGRLGAKPNLGSPYLEPTQE
jgi:AAA15 family ATPase/GTPase